MSHEEVTEKHDVEKHIPSRREKIVHLNQFEIEQRLKKFPWLPRNTNAYTVTEESAQIRKGEFEWEKLPTVVARFILDFFRDEELFNLRGLSTFFYRAFYLQKKNIDYARVSWLARRGRKFTKLLKLKFDSKQCTENDLQVVLASSFPSLVELFLASYSNLRIMVMQSHLNLRGLKINLQEIDDLQFISDVNFPALEALVCSTEEIKSEAENFNCIRHFTGHKNLRKFTFDDRRPSLEEIRGLNKLKFPRLRLVGAVLLDSEDETEENILEYLKPQDIGYTHNFGRTWIVDDESDYSDFGECCLIL